ncbi:MAG: Dabb family protein [Bacteroidetes bacterium]|nr:MAG: Dabb family protein [Bacteroidota bacterium]
MKQVLLLSVCLLLAMGCTSPDTASTEATTQQSPTSEQEKVSEKQLRHVVLFKFKEEATPEDIARVEQAFAALPGQIPEIQDFEWGTNNSPEGLDKGFTHCFLLTFGSEADRETYLPHPAHKAFGEVLKPQLEDVLVIDYWAKK